MTEPRHHSYRNVKALVGAAQLEDSERLALIDSAEGLLLASEKETDETGRLRSKARATLMLAVVRGRVSAAAARRLMSLIECCGPPQFAALGARPAAL